MQIEILKLECVLQNNKKYFLSSPSKVLHSLSANLEDTAVATGLEKVNLHPNPQIMC